MPEKSNPETAKPVAEKKPRTRKPRASATASEKTASEPRRAAAKSAASDGTAAKPRRRSAAPRKPRAKRTPAAVAASEAQSAPEAPIEASPVEPPPVQSAAIAAEVFPADVPAAILFETENPSLMKSVPPLMRSVSPAEPAVARKSPIAPEALPAPATHWSWSGAPIAATVAFVATLGALLMGYWTGYSVGSEAMGDTAVTVASASEKTPTMLANEERLVQEVRLGQMETLTAAEPAIEPVEAPVAVTPGTEATRPEAAPTEGLHLQVSALKSPQAASELRRRLESQGFPVRVETPTEGKLVRVYVGPIADAAALNEWTSELRKEGLEPFPKRL